MLFIRKTLSEGGIQFYYNIGIFHTLPLLSQLAFLPVQVFQVLAVIPMPLRMGGIFRSSGAEQHRKSMSPDHRSPNYYFCQLYLLSVISQKRSETFRKKEKISNCAVGCSKEHPTHFPHSQNLRLRANASACASAFCSFGSGLQSKAPHALP